MGNFLNSQVELDSICGKMGKAVVLITESVRKGRKFLSRNKFVRAWF